jgi:hypothetical protein
LKVRRPRRDRWRRRTIICRAWDEAADAAGIDDAAKEGVAKALARFVRSLWAADVIGWRKLQLLALPKFMELTREAGFTGSDEHLKQICRLPRGFIDRDRARGRAIAIHDRDAKAFSDRLPRIRRDYSSLRPGELIIGDVHPIDILYRRSDGTTATPKAVSWMDARSRYLVSHPVFLAPGEGVRMAHVAASFAAFVRDEQMMPARLLLDNGAEYNCAEFAKHALRLVADDRFPLDGINDDDARTIIKALPYNASAKAIESRFRLLENNFRDLGGFIGGDRMKSKTSNVGKAPTPFDGTPENLWREIVGTRVQFLNHTPSPVIDGKTPAEIWARRERHKVDYHDLQAAFGVEKTRRLNQGGFSLDGSRYSHDVLAARPDLSGVVIYKPIFGPDILAVHDPRTGEFLCHASPDHRYGALDVAGARESAGRKKLARGSIGVMRRDFDAVDISGVMRAFIELNPEYATPAPAATIALSGEKARAADDRRRLAERGEPSAPKEPEEDFFDLVAKRTNSGS